MESFPRTDHPLSLRQILVGLRAPIFLALLLFFAGFAYGYLNPTVAEPWMEQLEELAEGLHGASPLTIFITIFINNSLTAGLSILLGPFLGILPAVSAVVNGGLLGIVALRHGEELWKIIPHGIFELPAVFLAWGLGFWCAGALLSHSRLHVLKVRMKAGLDLYVRLIVPLLFIAAMIETAAILFLP